MTINDIRNVRSFAPIPVLVAVLFMVLLIVPLSATAQVAIANTISDENGNYTFSDIPAGNYTIEVAYYTPAMGSGMWFIGSNNTTVSAGEHRDGLDVWLTSGNEADALEIMNATIDPSGLTGTSTISGRTVAYMGSVTTVTNVTVLLIKTDESEDPPSQPENMTVLAKTISDENGNYTFSDLPAGDYTIEVAYYTYIPAMGGDIWFIGSNNTNVSAGEYLDGLDVWLTLGSEADAHDILNATIDPSGLTGTSTISGQTVAYDRLGSVRTMGNATVLLIKTDESEDPPSQPENMTVLAKTISDENGNYTFSDLPAGDYVINVAYYTTAMGGKWFIGSNNTNVSAGEYRDGLDVWLTFGSDTDALEIVNAIIDSGGASGTSTISGQTVAYDRLGNVRTMGNATVIISTYLKGDLSGDDLLTSADALIALEMAVGSREPDLLVGDMNLDGVVTSLDALLILQVA